MPALAYQSADLTSGAAGLPVVLASLSLVGLAIALSWWLGLGVGRELVVASIRAAVQLLAVGLLFAFIFGSAFAQWWAWLWVGVMVVIAAVVVVRRAAFRIERLPLVAGFTILGSTLISIAVTFGFGVLPYDPVALVVIAGITIGNAVPSAVLGVNQAVGLARDRPGEIEAALALGLDRRQVTRFIAPRAARSALIPQIERTKVVGLIALPGAMTGLLLAGVEPIDAVVVQLLVMYLVLGAAAVCVVSVVAAVSRATVTDDLRAAPWTREVGE
jgi:putative ABC transport system permease protein